MNATKRPVSAACVTNGRSALEHVHTVGLVGDPRLLAVRIGGIRHLATGRRLRRAIRLFAAIALPLSDLPQLLRAIEHYHAGADKSPGTSHLKEHSSDSTGLTERNSILVMFRVACHTGVLMHQVWHEA